MAPSWEDPNILWQYMSSRQVYLEKKLSFAYSTNSEKDVNIVICKFKSYSICPAGQAQLDLYFWLNLKKCADFSCPSIEWLAF